MMAASSQTLTCYRKNYQDEFHTKENARWCQPRPLWQGSQGLEGRLFGARRQGHVWHGGADEEVRR